MELSGASAFLLLSKTEGNSPHIEILPSLSAAIRRWDVSTRLSPLYCFKPRTAKSPRRKRFQGSGTLFFIGPVDPHYARNLATAGVEVWLTLGLFNLLFYTASPTTAKQIRSWARTSAGRYESWRIIEGKVTSISFRRRDTALKSGWRDDLADFLESPVSGELQEAVNEYCPLMASSLARAAEAWPAAHEMLRKAGGDLLEILQEEEQAPEHEARYMKLYLFNKTNAGLARFSSQTFAGTSPIVETECHFWTHSLLGIGIASMALFRLRQFLADTLGAMRIPQRLERLDTVAVDGRELARLSGKDEFWFRDHLAALDLKSKDERENLLPLITYFSGRDGFKCTLNTLSAPLVVVSASNSLRWTLLTISHEVCHIIIRGALGVLLPDLAKDNEVAVAFKNWRSPQDNILDEARRLVCLSGVGMEVEKHSDPQQAEPRNAQEFGRILRRNYHEVEEILTHVIDFLYFYQGIESYVAGIWLSWSVIPNIGSRVPEYVIRTLCAVLANHLRRESQSEELARQEVLRELRRLDAEKVGGAYVKEAIDYLEREWDSEIRQRLITRKPL